MKIDSCLNLVFGSWLWDNKIFILQVLCLEIFCSDLSKATGNQFQRDFCRASETSSLFQSTNHNHVHSSDQSMTPPVREEKRENEPITKSCCLSFHLSSQLLLHTWAKVTFLSWELLEVSGWWQVDMEHWSPSPVNSPRPLQGELQTSCSSSLCAFEGVLNYPTEIPISPANRKGILINNLKFAL